MKNLRNQYKQRANLGWNQEKYFNNWKLMHVTICEKEEDMRNDFKCDIMHHSTSVESVV